MSIQRHEYEMSVWKEALAETGLRKEEEKMAIIGAHDMEYLGRATEGLLTTKLNGTHSFTFQMPDKFFDSKTGDFIHNEFVDAIFNESKIKLKYKNQWYEFYVKSVNDTKHFKSYMKNYTCQDAFIDELSRNGYGITFDEELYNNVAELGDFNEEILKDSTWEYDASLNWGDFTEYVEEKLFKIPLSVFGGKIQAHKLEYHPDSNKKILNIYTMETREIEMGDDLARETYFWDQYNKDGSKSNALLTNSLIEIEGESEYIYVPYSQLNFCYISTDTEQNNGLTESFVATEEPAQYGDKGYAISPFTVDPTGLIQFIYIPEGAEVEVDVAGLLKNKNYTYVITVAEWNKMLETQSQYFYCFEDYRDENGFKKKIIKNRVDFSQEDYIYGNWACYYEGYLSKIGDLDVVNGKKISITDRIEINISKDVDQYVKVYNNLATEYTGLYTCEKWQFDPEKDSEYRVCSKISTRQIVPQLARNLIQNGKKINSTVGWEIMSSYLTSISERNAKLIFDTIQESNPIPVPNENYSIDIGKITETYLIFQPALSSVIAVLNREVNNILSKISDINKYGVAHPARPLDSDAKFFIYEISTTSSYWEGLSTEEKNRIRSAVNEINILVNKRYSQYVNGTTTIVEPAGALTERNAMVNFGIVGQGHNIEKGKIYVLGIKIREPSEKTLEKLDFLPTEESVLKEGFIRVGHGELINDGDYGFSDYFDIPLSNLISNDGEAIYFLIKPKNTYSNPYIAIYSNAPYELTDFELFEAYTKGADQFDTTVFRYSGRELFSGYVENETAKYYHSARYTPEQMRNLVLFEDDVMSGDTYEYLQYFIQQLKIKGKDIAYDTFCAKQYLSESGNETSLPLDSKIYNEDDYEIITNYIDLNQCQYYKNNASATEFDCKCNSNSYNKVCLYQKYGYCPYRFQTEKHCRKIRTLNGEKSNRFNLTQELSKVFQIYPMYWTSHSNNGHIFTQEEAVQAGMRESITEGRDDWPDKRVFYITEKGRENKVGFRYEKNLSNISRTLDSDNIVTKLYVLDVDSEISKTGLSSIKTAEDNPSKDNFIIDFSYYTMRGLLDKERTDADLFGIDGNDMGFLKTLGYLNTQYDSLSNKIINLSAESFTELQANLEVNLNGIETAQKKLRAIEKKMSPYTAKNGTTYSESSTFKSYQGEYVEQYAIYVQLIEDTFYTDGVSIKGKNVLPADFLQDLSIENIRKLWVETHDYQYGILGQYNKEYLQISEWKKEQASYLKRINNLSVAFYQKYEPYLKEGVWSDGNYLTDNAYYFGALQVAKRGAIPQVHYSISTVDIEVKDKEGDYIFSPADTTYVEDIGMFGVNPHTGLPNRLKTIVSNLTEKIDNPEQNKIEVQDFTTKFDDLFQQVTATVQSLSFNENIYTRASNFTAQQNIKTESLQGALSENNLTLLSTEEENISLDSTGQSGSDINNHANKYQLNGQGLFFSNNGGQSWNVAVTPNGINADYIKTGTLDASKIRIVDGNYIYFSWDRNGISAYRDPKTVTSARAFKDFSQFNKYGLSLVENGKIRLRAGYAFVSTDATDGGNIEKEAEVRGDTPIGFYLYNSEGVPIFATESATNSNDAKKETARISLVGEMLATNASTIAMYLFTYGGTCYTPTTITAYILPNEDQIIRSVSATVVEDTASYTIPVGSPARPVDCAAFITYRDKTSNNPHINTIEITDTEGNVFVYTSLSVTYLDDDFVWGKMPNNKYVRNRRLSFSSNRGTSNFVLLETSNGISYQGIVSFTTERVAAFTLSTTETITSQTLIQNNSQITGVNLTSTTSGSDFIYHEFQAYRSLYYINNKYFTQRTGESSGAEGKVALYLNNRTDLDSETASSHSRLLTCCSSEKDTTKYIKNIFTILKDGSLHMGGTIRATGDATDLPDQIEINNDTYLRIVNGQLQMSFDNIVDINDPSKSIESYVDDSISDLPTQSHTHRLLSESVEIDRVPILSAQDAANINDLSDLVNILSQIQIPAYWYDSITGKELLAINRDGLYNPTGPAQE